MLTTRRGVGWTGVRRSGGRVVGAGTGSQLKPGARVGSAGSETSSCQLSCDTDAVGAGRDGLRDDGDDSGDSTGEFIGAFRRFALRVDTVGLGCDGPCGGGDDGELTVASLKALLGLVPGNEG